VDIVGAAVGFDLLGAERVVCSRVPTGHGSIRIAHGVCSVPAPATAELLKGVPLVDVPVDAELTTPTGAAILKVVVDSYGRRPEMTIERIGYGAGTRDLHDRPNLLRIFVGTADVSAETDVVCLLETNLDDVSPEVLGFAKQQLLAAGALDVYSTPIQMKKDRPGTLLSVLCAPADRERLEAIIFAETATFGIRRSMLERTKRLRQEHTVQTPWGPVRGKLGWRSSGDKTFSPEFEDCARVARERGVPLRDVYRAAEAAYLAERAPPVPELPAAAHDHGHSHDHGHDHSHDHGH
jgi:uncharacterized protein (TIGR00299 family) protein